MAVNDVPEAYGDDDFRGVPTDFPPYHGRSNPWDDDNHATQRWIQFKDGKADVDVESLGVRLYGGSEDGFGTLGDFKKDDWDVAWDALS